MNLYELAPDDDGAGEMEKSKVIGSLFLKADQQFAEAVEKRVGNFNDPATGFESRIVLLFFTFFASGTDMGCIMALLNGLLASGISKHPDKDSAVAARLWQDGK